MMREAVDRAVQLRRSHPGKIKLFGVSPAWKKICPSANFLVKYTKRETDNALDGDSALELATHNYGRDEWWLLLDPAPSAGPDDDSEDMTAGGVKAWGELDPRAAFELSQDSSS